MNAWKEWGPLCILVFVLLTFCLFIVFFAFANEWFVTDQFAGPEEPPTPFPKYVLLLFLAAVFSLALSIGFSFMASGLLFSLFAFICHFKKRKPLEEDKRLEERER